MNLDPSPKNTGAKSKQVLVLGVPWAWAHSPGWPHRKENPAAAPPPLTPPPSTRVDRTSGTNGNGRTPPTDK